MSCVVCSLPEARRKLLERLLLDSTSTVETVGQQFRIDYDAIREHMATHVKEPVGAIDGLDELLTEFREVIESCRTLVETEEDAANFGAYTNMVKSYHTMVLASEEQKRKDAADRLKADTLMEAIVSKVFNPVLTDIAKTVLSEVARLRDDTKKAGATDIVYDQQFQETVRRLGTLIQDAVTPHTETLKIVVAGKDPTKVKGKR